MVAGTSTSGGMGGFSNTSSGARVTVSTPAAAGAQRDNADFQTGDKVAHGKWGVGTVVAVKGTGDDMELQIAFPAPVGIKRLLAAFAPIKKA